MYMARYIAAKKSIIPNNNFSYVSIITSMKPEAVTVI